MDPKSLHLSCADRYGDSTCLKFIFVNDIESEILDKQFRDILFEIIVVHA